MCLLQTSLWLTFASFDRDYVKYLKNQRAKQSFLRMQRYGPYRIADAVEVEMLSQIICCLRQEGEGRTMKANGVRKGDHDGIGF
jgi:hypothetical protein